LTNTVFSVQHGAVVRGEVNETIGERLRRLRLEKGFSQRELSGPGVSYAYISRIEAGTRQPSVKALRVLARKLHVSPEYLETGSELRDVDNRELRLADAELALRLGGEPAEVEKLLAKLLEEASAAGDVVSARRATIGLGVAAFRRGDQKATIAHLEPIAHPDALAPDENADVYSTLGQAYVSLGETQRVTDLYRRCLDAIGDSNPIAYITYATYLSYALSDAGDLEGARDVVNSVLERADAVGDLYSQVRVYWSAARLEAREGREALALEHIRHAIALLRATEDTLQLGRANVLAADIALADEDPGSAEEHLVQAERLLGQAPEPTDFATLRTVQARWAAEAGLPDKAISYAEDALHVGGTEPGESAEATWALAEALAAKGSVDEAVSRFEEAIDLYVAGKRMRDAARVCRAYASVLRAAGREDAAFAALERSADLAMRTSSAPAAG
jgi:transcriptional regulator with XRE-family HTH domain